MDEVILARHGESELSVAGTVNGDPAVACALTETGVEQARRLAERLADVEIDLCVTSGCVRARTAVYLRTAAAAAGGIPSTTSAGLHSASATFWSRCAVSR